MNKLLKIIISEVVVGAIGFVLYYFYLLSLGRTDWVAGIGLSLIVILTVFLLVTTLVVALITRLIEKRNAANPELPQKRYGLVFWLIVAVIFIIFVATLPYTIPLVGKVRNSYDKRDCIQVITRAQQPKTGEIREYSTPCDVPSGWTVIK